MVSRNNILSKIIHGNEDFCFLCFNSVDENAIYVEDLILVEGAFTETMLVVLEYVIGNETLNNMYKNGAICENCKTLAVNSYKFIKLCNENSANILNTLESINDSCENTIQDLTKYKSLFVALNINDFTNQQYYDEKHLKHSPSYVHKRFISLANLELNSNIEVTTYIPQRKFSTKTKVNKKKCKIKKEPINYNIPEIATSDLVYDFNNLMCYKCKECHKSFQDESEFRRHYFKKHYPRDVKCPKCPKSFISVDMLKYHDKENHYGLFCSQCGKKFINKYVLQKHETNHDVKIICQECGRVYRSSEAFYKHITNKVCSQKMRKSSDQAVHTCDYCNKKFCHKPYLAKHIQHEHENAEGFKCQFCEKKFYTPSGLKAHIVKHTLEKKYFCKECDGRFVSKTSLLYHTRLHTGERPYQCDYCNKAFLSASRRLDHERRHHLAPSLECEICQSKFKAASSLLKHKRRHFIKTLHSDM